jgi:hypothetical protein
VREIIVYCSTTFNIALTAVSARARSVSSFLVRHAFVTFCYSALYYAITISIKKCFSNQQKPHVLRFRQKGDYNQHQRLYSMDRGSHSKLRLWTNITAWYLRTCHLGILGIFHSCSRKFCICCWLLVWKACKSKGHATRANRGSLSRNNESHLQLDDIHYFHNKKGVSIQGVFNSYLHELYMNCDRIYRDTSGKSIRKMLRVL